MRKLVLLAVSAVYFTLATPVRAQFCPGVAPWVFDDVLASNPFCANITWMAENGITLGCQTIDANHRLYCPTLSVTRDAMAAFMNRLGNVRVEAVGTGPGLLGGPITGIGTITLAPTQLLPTVACTAGQIPLWNGNAWTCANTGAGGGTVTNVGSGTGLTGGPITTSGALSIAAGYQLPQGCANGQVAKSNGSNAWSCANDANGGGTVTNVATGAGLTGGPITTTGTLSVNTAVIQARVSGNCAVGSSIRAIAVDGTVTCQSDGAPNAFVQNGNAFGSQAVLGTSDNNALDVRVSNARVMRYEPSATTGNVVGGNAVNLAVVGVRGAVIAGGGAPAGGEPLLGPGPFTNVVRDSYGTIGGGLANVVGDTNADFIDSLAGTVAGGLLNTAFLKGATVGGGMQNTALNILSTVAGGLHNQANGTYASVGGGRDNVAQTDSTTVGGGTQNTALQDFSTVGGGQLNYAQGQWSTIGGGYDNEATDSYGTVGGGYINQATAPYGTVAGGQFNRAFGDSSVVGGGKLNYATALYSTVAGGFNNQATAVDSTVLGGEDNIASGSLSMAGGYKARANGHGCFAWGDFSTSNTISCNADNRFVVRALGGVFFFAGGSTQATYTGVMLPPGATAWVAGSDRNLKENVVAVEPREVLERVAAMPIATWNLKGQGAAIRHMGPMAQDFRDAFGLGETELGISTIDADGVALAAIQGLNAKLEAQARQLAMERDVRERQAREIADLKRAVEVLMARTGADNQVAVR